MSKERDPLLTGPEAAERCGLAASTWRGYVRAGYVRAADDPDLGSPPNRRTPRWRQSYVDHFRTHRIGQGRGPKTRVADLTG